MLSGPQSSSLLASRLPHYSRLHYSRLHYSRPHYSRLQDCHLPLPPFHGTTLPSISHFSQGSHAFQWSLANLAADSDALLLLHVRPPVAEMFDRESIYLASEEVYALQRQLQAESQQLLDDLAQAASREGPENLQVECSSEEGDPREVILSEAKRVAADLIVVGSRGLGAVGRCVLRDWCSPLSLPCLFMGAAQHAWFF
ncbi:unnamed protein product [Closterium sp. Naga37s-1]|nr:unnamed protein product [Closterium sp. Naga37s-1]